jgi:uncharacterized protein YndB with AHSA1/START domain
VGSVTNWTIQLEQAYEAPLEKVWRALATETHLREWYFPQLQRFEPVTGFAFAFTDEGSRYQKQWRVTQVVVGSKLAHSWRYKGYLGNSEVTVDLGEEGDKTKLILT